MAIRWQVTIDCAAPAKLAEFWAFALDYEVESAPEGYGSWEDYFRANDIPEEEWDDGASIVDPAGVGQRIYFQRVPERKAVKNRLHPDLLVRGDATTHEERWTRVMAAVARLSAAGATVVTEDSWQGRPHHVVMADPEGNEFCIV
jgi:hypothetical protein